MLNVTSLNVDVVEFYPSIKSNLLDEAIEFASKHTQISDRDKEIIMHSKKSLLFHENHPWQKSQQTDNFDVTMGSFDGAETCELIGTYIVNKTQNVINNNDIGLYRDDGLAVLKNRSLCQANRFANQLTAIFQDIGLKITTKICSKVINFLDVTFNIDTGTYKPFMKPNNRILYVNKHSNHPNNIITRIQSIQDYRIYLATNINLTPRHKNTKTPLPMLDTTTGLSLKTALNEKTKEPGR